MGDGCAQGRSCQVIRAPGLGRSPRYLRSREIPLSVLKGRWREIPSEWTKRLETVVWRKYGRVVFAILIRAKVENWRKEKVEGTFHKP